MSHTPGPWRIGHKHGSPIRIIGGDMTLALVSPQGEANARLIAAAPDLLEALTGALAILDTHEMNKKAPHVLAGIRSAIKKARGE